MPRPAPLTQAVPAWDLFLRLFHWTLATLMVASVTTGLLGGNLMKWHMWSGYAILGLLALRLAWGPATADDTVVTAHADAATIPWAAGWSC